MSGQTKTFESEHEDIVVRAHFLITNNPTHLPPRPLLPRVKTYNSPLSILLTAFAVPDSGSSHDAQADYYGRRLATCSSDRTIKIFDISGESPSFLAELRGHEGPVWQVAWAHPRFGNILASCSYDHKVFVWKETATNQWVKIHEYVKHESSVNSIAWAPHELGLILAAASSDRRISVISYRPSDETWHDVSWDAHAIGCNSVSWAPASAPESLLTIPSSSGQQSAASSSLIRRLVSGGCDNLVKIWRFNEVEGTWKEDKTLEGHTDWVRDVAWCPNIGLPGDMIASCSQDRSVIIWKQEDSSLDWERVKLPLFPATVWRVSWSVTGNILAVSSGDMKVTLWKENVDGEWRKIQDMSEAGSGAVAGSAAPVAAGGFKA